jgi:guanylate kinase
VLSGPSGAGKSTVVTQLRVLCPRIWISVSATTRAPRPGEREGVDYYFVDQDRFDYMVARGELLEWASFAGNCYGTPRQPVEDKLAAGIPVLLEIDLQGARQVRAAMPQAQLVFLAPPDWHELVRRLTARATETPADVERRLAAAREEMARQSDFDITLINTDVHAVCAQLIASMQSPSENRKA